MEKVSQKGKLILTRRLTERHSSTRKEFCRVEKTLSHTFPRSYLDCWFHIHITMYIAYMVHNLCWLMGFKSRSEYTIAKHI